MFAELLKMIRESEDDDITGVLEFLIKMYSTEIGDVAWELCVHLVRSGESRVGAVSYVLEGEVRGVGLEGRG